MHGLRPETECLAAQTGKSAIFFLFLPFPYLIGELEFRYADVIPAELGLLPLYGRKRKHEVHCEGPSQAEGGSATLGTRKTSAS